MDSMNPNASYPSYPDPIRPNLRPVDSRSTASPSNDFSIAGSIDNESTFDVATGESVPSRF